MSFFAVRPYLSTVFFIWGAVHGIVHRKSSSHSAFARLRSSTASDEGRREKRGGEQAPRRDSVGFGLDHHVCR
ncbi:hypothetical protein PUN28_003233 [Cardiocondyla obscurior]|uniref:Secreted protein n=1 Tax=Cardiocondyla obscurior TaxID=286306 RepID=A0AAW2GKZ2_9HYME